ncbi:hypothetical protein CCMA1212_002226 [Trichoderma ghanense]|uniref:Uncharacterized protein n=1 Tax=Trichoderma ghanense TaxID=65468 RepID=A0ABY2HFR4_9HYPO
MVLLTSPRPLSLPLSGRNDKLDLGRGDDALPPMAAQTHLHVHTRSAAAAAAVRYHSNWIPVPCNGNPPASTFAGNSNATGENFWDTADSALSVRPAS